jgi:hypothetical protein
MIPLEMSNSVAPRPARNSKEIMFDAGVSYGPKQARRYRECGRESKRVVIILWRSLVRRNLTFLA